ncbi:MAG: hypothetical protein HXY43_16385 [Fischerella sp.]|uniref:hypothetical protein n=1 Tax=Fischerella sp. TaxID=1191 RepID=UPI0018050CD2|nr:hypothetical protein [Fischerella sp.]NWF60783.1 hypothetical protein [Fischerella sp.]
MGKLIIIHIDGDFDNGFTVYLQIWTEGDRQLIATARGKLPPAKDLYENYTIDDLEPDLRKAVKRGLQLAIFNSCDGLEIAQQLAHLHVPFDVCICIKTTSIEI